MSTNLVISLLDDIAELKTQVAELTMADVPDKVRREIEIACLERMAAKREDALEGIPYGLESRKLGASLYNWENHFCCELVKEADRIRLEANAEIVLTKQQSKTVKKLTSNGGTHWADNDGAIYVDCKDGIAYINKDGAIQWQR